MRKESIFGNGKRAEELLLILKRNARKPGTVTITKPETK